MFSRCLTKYGIIILLIIIQTLEPGSLCAQQETEGRKFYAGVEMGAGRLMLSENNFNENRSTNYELGFYGGYIPVRMLRIGINVNGFLVESYGIENPSKGISISNTQLQLQLFPWQTSSVFINIMGGRSTYINHHPDGSNAKGFAGTIGFGYEYPLRKKLALSLNLNFCAGRFKDVKFPESPVISQHFNVFGITAGLCYR